jgi:hypothetical protein
MEGIKPRFEFRTWAKNFGKVEQKLYDLSSCEKIRESKEIYIISAGNNENNTKIRDKLMDIKVLVQEKKGLEQWDPLMKGEFPMGATMLREEVFPAFGVEMPELSHNEYSLDMFLRDDIQPHPKIIPVQVFKRRFAFTVEDCITELGEIQFNGAAQQTVAVESVDIEAILKAKDMLGLNDYENLNYLRSIKRVLGMEPFPGMYEL